MQGNDQDKPRWLDIMRRDVIDSLLPMTESSTHFSYLLQNIGASAIIARTIPNFIADGIGPFNMQFLFLLAAAIIHLGWASIRGTAGTVTFFVNVWYRERSFRFF